MDWQQMNSSEFIKDCVKRKEAIWLWGLVIYVRSQCAGVLGLQTEEVVPVQAQSQGCGVELQEG